MGKNTQGGCHSPAEELKSSMQETPSRPLAVPSELPAPPPCQVPWLQNCGVGQLGRIWIPPTGVVLGKEAHATKYVTYDQKNKPTISLNAAYPNARIVRQAADFLVNFVIAGGAKTAGRHGRESQPSTCLRAQTSRNNIFLLACFSSSVRGLEHG